MCGITFRVFPFLASLVDNFFSTSFQLGNLHDIGVNGCRQEPMNRIPYLPHWVCTPAEEQNELFLERIEIPSANACRPSSSEQESDSNERVRLSCSDGFSSSSRDSS